MLGPIGKKDLPIFAIREITTNLHNQPGQFANDTGYPIFPGSRCRNQECQDNNLC
jgi:hypothetical protein